MNIMDNSPIEVPTVGRVVTETYEVEKLQDCHLYLLPSNNNAFADKTKEVFNMLIEKMRASQLLNNYQLEILSQVLQLDNHPKLSEAIREDHSNFVMPLFTPNRSNKQYLIVRSEEKELFSHIPLMIYTSERLTKNSAVDLMIKDALNNTDSFINKTKNNWESIDFWKRVIVNQASGMHSTFGMAVSKSLVKEALGKDGELTHQKQIELQEEFVNNLHDVKADNNNVEKMARVKLILGCISNEDILKYLLTLPDEGINVFSDKISPTRIAEQSKLMIQVKYVGHIDNKKPADGRFRVFINKGGVSVQVHFGRRSALLIYIIYLLDVIKSEHVNSLDISQYGELFNRLYEDCYGYNGGEEQFKTLFGKGNSEQELLRHSYGDITKAVGKVCTYYGESKTPFVIPDAQSHLYIPKEKIIIDDRLLKYL